jgi:hypothetical protein
MNFSESNKYPKILKFCEYALHGKIYLHKNIGTVLITFNYILYFMSFIYYLINAYMIRINHNLGLV